MIWELAGGLRESLGNRLPTNLQVETASGAGGWHVRDCSILGALASHHDGQRMCSEGSGNSGWVSHARGGMVTESGRPNRLQKEMGGIQRE